MNILEKAYTRSLLIFHIFEITSLHFLFTTLNAMRREAQRGARPAAPPVPDPHIFRCAHRPVLVTFNQNFRPTFVDYLEGNHEVTPELRRQCCVKRYLEYVDGIYFFVTTKDH